ncbi:zinc finger protein 43-like [Musca vetustissima]|uniref:zinc finger protein 43-like n=1 Tax=Musca vetustissima TaxID=27455 RepID=UPI002AB75BAE|nr:zinc finger protein 43-like [Musca vetustissima]
MARYPSKKRLARHMNYHNPAKEVICDICGKILRTLGTLHKHKQVVHEKKVKKDPEQCTYCGKWYATHSTLQFHVLNMHIHTDKEHRCEICGFVSTTREAKKKHIRFKHTAEKRHKCGLCDKAFKVPTLLREHMATHTGVDLYKCNYCTATFKSKSNRSNHCKRNHPLEYPSKKRLTRHLEYHNPAKEVICDICGKVLRTRNTLQKHKAVVHTKKVKKEPEQCSYCGKWYSTRSTLQFHVLNMHIHTDREHRCEICGFVSTTREAKKKHIRFKHRAQKRHKCGLCDKAFKVPTLLKEHTATHTGVDLYNCAYCDASFKSKSNRSTHYKRHHPAEYMANMRRRPCPSSINNYIQNPAVNTEMQ